MGKQNFITRPKLHLVIKVKQYNNFTDYKSLTATPSNPYSTIDPPTSTISRPPTPSPHHSK